MSTTAILAMAWGVVYLATEALTIGISVESGVPLWSGIFRVMSQLQVNAQTDAIAVYPQLNAPNAIALFISSAVSV